MTEDLMVSILAGFVVMAATALAFTHDYKTREAFDKNCAELNGVPIHVDINICIKGTSVVETSK